jgi:hypothetical protein
MCWLPWNKSLQTYSSGDNQLNVFGYEILEEYLDKITCNDLINEINQYLRWESYMISKFSYLNVRKDNAINNKSDGYDLDVRAIIHFQNLSEWAKRLFISNKIEKMFESRYGEKFVLESITAQIDEPSMLKRGYHIDGYAPQFKAFIYLNDVKNYNDQPFTLIPKSHKCRIRKSICIMYNLLRGYKITDLRILFSDKKSLSFFSDAGTMILSNQNIAHKGWRQKTGKRRYMIVCYLVPKKFYKKRVFPIGSSNKSLKLKNDLNTVRNSLDLKRLD